ncbi:MAG: hydantoinase/oxoprolinase family protein [Caldisphaeraceae archaeon]|nr:hydantoinase/oxoprolinase family protein [Caldisphaeraceae archaeon]
MSTIAVDVGGTFTDAIYIDNEGKLRVTKVPTTPLNPALGVINSIKKSKGLNEVEEVLHATTIATNSILGQINLELPRVALITTKGFKDIIEIGRQNRPKLYDAFFTKPRPFVPRELRYEVNERTTYEGKVLKGIDEDEINDIANDMIKKGVVSVAVSFLNSYANNENERKAKELLQDRFSFITISSDVSPEPREYERTSTAIINALLQPIVSSYISSLASSLSGLRSPRFSIMSSAGGLISLEEAIERPVQLIESGPAAGAIAALELSKLLGIKNVIGFDMGGTTAKASSIIDNEIEIVDEYEVGGESHHGRIVKGSGYPIRFPFIDLAEVSAGGGTIIWRDKAGGLNVGPISVGAEPGPASYGRGGDKPTITDANLAIGRLGENLAGGQIKLRKDLAISALKALGEPIEVSLQALELINLEMARAVRLVTVERGLDPSSFTIMAFGGAGPMHAAYLAEEIGVKSIVIPPEPGLFSALGLLLADSRFEARKAFPRNLEQAFSELEAKLREKLGDVDEFLRYIDVRYEGQGYELRLQVTSFDRHEIEKEFEELHKRTYGFTLSIPIEVVSARVFAIKKRKKVSLEEARENGVKSPLGYREAIIRDHWEEVPIYRREGLPKGFSIKGPAIIEEYSSTTVVPDGWTASVISMGSMIIERC